MNHVAVVEDWPNDRTAKSIEPSVPFDQLEVGTKLYRSTSEIEQKAAMWDFLMEVAEANSKNSGFVIGDNLKAKFACRYWTSRQEVEDEILKRMKNHGR